MAPAPPAPRSSLLLRLAFGAPDADAASHEVRICPPLPPPHRVPSPGCCCCARRAQVVVGDQTDAEPVAMQPSTPVRSERTVQLPPDTPGRTQQNPRSLSSTLRSDSIASCASTVLFAGDESSPRTPSKGALAATAAAAVASADLAAADVSAGLEEMDPSEREYLLRLLFERFAAHGKDREQAPHKQIALRSFGPARYGTLVHTLREDVRLYEGRLGAKSRNPPFVFSDFASRPKRDSSEPQLDSVHFAKLCRECAPSRAIYPATCPFPLLPTYARPDYAQRTDQRLLCPHQVWHSRRAHRRRGLHGNQPHRGPGRHLLP